MPTNLPPEIKSKIEAQALTERIYEPKYGGKDHSGYNTMMLYEVNDEREDCCERGATFGYSLAEREIERLKGLIENIYLGNIITEDVPWQQFKTENNL